MCFNLFEYSVEEQTDCIFDMGHPRRIWCNASTGKLPEDSRELASLTGELPRFDVPIGAPSSVRTVPF